MSEGPRVSVRQVGPSTGEGSVRGHTILIDRPDSKGGSDRGPMGGELILLGLGGCFMSNLLAAIRERELPVSDVELTVTAHTEGTPPKMTSFEIRVSADHADPATLGKLATIAERGCIASNTLKQGSTISVVIEDARARDPAGSASNA